MISFLPLGGGPLHAAFASLSTRVHPIQSTLLPHRLRCRMQDLLPIAAYSLVSKSTPPQPSPTTAAAADGSDGKGEVKEAPVPVAVLPI